MKVNVFYWIKILLISLFLGTLIILFVNLKKEKLKVKNQPDIFLEKQKIEKEFLDSYVNELINCKYENVSYELNKIIQKRPLKDNLVDIHSMTKENTLKRYDFYAIYYVILMDNKEFLFKNKEQQDNFIREIKKFNSNQEYQSLKRKMGISKETSNEDLNNIISTKKEEYEKRLAEIEAKRKAEQEALAKRQMEQQKEKESISQPNIITNQASLSEYQQYAHDLVINTYGWTEYDFQSLVNLWNRESEWDPTCHNNSSGAHGIPQSLPASRMASEGADYYTNGYTQIRWGLKYIKERYGSPAAAWNHFLAKNWY